MDSRDYVVAHYNLKPLEKLAYNTSGNVLTIYEPFTHLAIGECWCQLVRQGASPDYGNALVLTLTLCMFGVAVTQRSWPP